MKNKPSVLFVCIHNAGRSQMAAGYLSHLAGDTIEVRSAGSAPAKSINPRVFDAMLEEGIDLTGQRPKIVSNSTIQACDFIISMGCGDACPFFQGKKYLNWQLDDPAGQDIDAIRSIRDQIRRHVDNLTKEIESIYQGKARSS